MDDLVFSISQRLMKVEKMSRFGQDVASIALGP
jgi:hypothetical protein